MWVCGRPALHQSEAAEGGQCVLSVVPSTQCRVVMSRSSAANSDVREDTM